MSTETEPNRAPSPEPRPAEEILPFQVRRFSDMASDLLRERILNGVLLPGAHLNEVALAEEMDISRPPLREALRVLHGEGLVTMRPGRGVFVATFDVESVLQLADIRIALEVETARLAAGRAAVQDREELTALLTEIESSLDTDGRTYPHHIDFHGALGQAAHNPRLAQHVDEIRQQLKIARVRSGNDPERARAALGEHRIIHEAVVRGDVEGADQAMRTHIEASTAAMIALIVAESEEETDDHR